MSRASHITNIVENRVRLQGPRIVGTICALFFLCGIGSVEQAGAQGVDSTITPVLDLFVADTNVVRSDWSFALTVGAQINLHAASFSTLPEVPSCCPNYTGKATLGATGGIEIRRAVEEQLAIELGLTYGTMGILFAAEETVVVFDGTGPADAVFAYALDADLAGLFIEPRFVYQPIEHLDLLIGPSLRILTAASAQQEERITSPARIRYPDGTRTRLPWDGTIPEVRRIGFGAYLGVGYAIPLLEDERFVPYVAASGRVHPSGIAGDIDWQVSNLGLSIGIRYRPQSHQVAPSIDSIPRIESVDSPTGS